MSRRGKNRLLQVAEYALYRVVYAGVRVSSEESLLRWGSRLGTLTRRILRGRDRLALANMLAAFPDRSHSEAREILNECWRHFGRETLVYLRTRTMSIDEIAARCPFVGSELLEGAMAEGHGTLLISAHFGGWEVAGLAIMGVVKNVTTVARKLDNEYLERDLITLRASTGAEVIDRRHAARSLFRALSRNGVVVLLPDQAVQPREGIQVTFLGRPAWTTDAPAKLALRLRSRIVFAFCIPDGTRHRLEFEEPIDVDQLREDERTPAALTQKINDVISKRIAQRPELWLWMHDRWKGNGALETSNDD